jgi:hypothetical protein
MDSGFAARAADTRRAFHADDAPKGIVAMMLATLAKDDEG